MTDKQYQTTPAWVSRPPEDHSFRSIFKWGGKNDYKHPGQGFLDVIKSGLGLEDADFSEPSCLGDAKVEHTVRPAIPPEDILLFEQVVGKGNLCVDTFSRLKYSSGKSMEEILGLRQAKIGRISDLVLHPRDKKDVEKIVGLCNKKQIPVHVYGGGSSVTLGLSCTGGGVTLVMSTHMNRMIRFSDINQTITVEPGMAGPVYEDLLNCAPEKLNASRSYTGGHFPQSFEFSSVGGWIAALGSGQASSLYGDAYDLVISQEYVTPAGILKTKAYPATATGPKVNDILKGCEGCFGVLVSVTLKVFPSYPDAYRPFSFMFPSFENGVTAVRRISQAGFGMPAILRLSDPEETDVAMKMYGLDGGMVDRFMGLKGFKGGKRCLMLGQTQGHPAFSKTVFTQVKKTARSCQGLYLTGYPMKKWYQGRFSDPYMRDSLNDFGVLIDTLEASVTWEHLDDLYTAVRQRIKSRPNTICMTHASHFYAHGTNLYFIFIMRMQALESYRRFQRGIIREIMNNHGSLSHHHGVGKMMGPMMEAHLGRNQMNVLRAVKAHFDPNGIMNPGGMGL